MTPEEEQQTRRHWQSLSDKDLDFVWLSSDVLPEERDFELLEEEFARRGRPLPIT